MRMMLIMNSNSNSLINSINFNRSFDYRLIIMVLGNLIGSLFIAWLTYNKVKEAKQEEKDFTEDQ